MLAFRLNLDQLELFYMACEELGAKTEDERVKVLIAMAKVGQIENIVETKMSKEEYVKHVTKNFGSVLNITKEEPPKDAN